MCALLSGLYIGGDHEGGGGGGGQGGRGWGLTKEGKKCVFKAEHYKQTILMHSRIIRYYVCSFCTKWYFVTPVDLYIAPQLGTEII